MEDILVRAVEKALSMGASYAEARFHSNRGFQSYFLNKQLIGASHMDETGVAIRAVVSGGLGFSSTSSTSWDHVERAVERAVASARTSSARLKKPVVLSEERLGRARYQVEEKIGLGSLSEHDKIGMVKEEMGSVELDVGDVKVQSFTLSYNEWVEEKAIVTSDGARIYSKIPRVEVFYNLSAAHGDRRANRWNQVAGTGGLEVFKESELASTINDDVRSLQISLAKAGSPPRGRLDVVLSPEIVGLSMHEAAGHPSEADRVLGREAAQAGLSYRVELKEGYAIGSEQVTVIDDPTIPGSYGYYLFDDEGVPARPRVLIDKGRLAELLHNRETGHLYGVGSNASARAVDYRSEPIVRMGNTYLAPGDYSFEELLEDVREGVYIKKYMEWNIDDYRWIARYVGLEAYIIRQGELAEPVRNVVLEVSTKDYFSRMDAVGKDLTFFAGTCGKGEPSQPLPVWMGGPHVRLRGVEVR
ncbi:MAG: TldD/PmbA family protein [Desulfurococcales archaeon]|nr:TldD/PmbA family protein [Desulfurococcales archaeon]